MNTYTLKVLVSDRWIIAAMGLLHGEAMEEAQMFTRFIIEQEVN